ncbi:hypothetical protein O181_049947 [Austropuccinia psidii MF-1]|uniref:Nucleolar protein 12 n=1 Tax=Austropuccinia psidii MF-1 TaxID=1389203 RepID=A0A9Q3DY06_9BASI|nr:hypothetical protein [Austropuccinia psidii MF-1]
MPHTNSRSKSDSRTAFQKKSQPFKNHKSSSSRPQIAVYDEQARHDYLTGFSARKKEAKAAAQERAKNRARAEKLELRRQLRATRLSKVQESIAEHDEWYGVESFTGLEPSQPLDNGAQKQTFIEEFEQGPSELTSTTVIIEPMEIDHSVLLDPTISKTSKCSKSKYDAQDRQFSGTGKGQTDKIQSAKKAKRIPYESKATRKIERAKKQRRREAKSKGKTHKKK